MASEQATQSPGRRTRPPFRLTRFDRAIAYVWPQLALKRAQASLALRAFEAVRPSESRKISKETRSPNAAAGAATAALRHNGRWFEQNSDLANGILAALVDNTIGTGILSNPAARLKDGTLAVDFNARALDLWKDWSADASACDVSGQLNWAAMQRISARATFRDGESFGQQVPGNAPGLPKDRPVPFSLEMLEADLVPVGITEPDSLIVQGVRVNTWNRPVSYLVEKQHPGAGVSAIVSTSSSDRLKEIPARFMLHSKLITRFGQMRGVSVFASIATRLQDISSIEEYERTAAEIAACLTAYIKKGAPEYHYQPPEDAGAADRRFIDLTPGAIIDQLQPGEEIGTVNTTRPNNELIPFRQAQLKAIAAGAGANYSTIARDYSGTYSSQRQSLVEAFAHYRPLTAMFVATLIAPVYAGFIRAAIDSGAIAAGLVRDLDPATLHRAEHDGPAMPAIDPVKEITARILALENHLTTRAQILRERGLLWSEILPQLEREAKELAQAGLTGADDAGGSAAPVDDDPNASTDGQPALAA